MTGRKILSAFGGVFAAVALCAVAGALWTAAGTGTGASEVGTFAAPSAPAASVDNGTVTLSWVADPAPDGSMVGYAVERRATAGAAWVDACGTAATSLTTLTTCDDVPGAGTYEWRVTAYFHSWTATSEESDTRTVGSVDSTPPTASVTSPANAAVLRAGAVLTATAADAGSGVSFVHFQRAPHGSTTWTDIGTNLTSPPYAQTWDTTAVADGLYDLRVVAADNEGNTTASALVTDVRVDNTQPLPTLSLAPGATGAYLSGPSLYVASESVGSFGLVATVTDAGSGAASATFPLLAAPGWTSHPAETISAPSHGPYPSSAFGWAAGAATPAPYPVTVADAAGNTATGTVTFVPDNTAPTTAVTAPAAGAPIRATATVSASAVETGAGVASVQLQSSPAGSGTWTDIGTADTTSPYSASWDTSGVADGLYDLRAVGVDRVGNSATSPISTVRVDNTAPTVALTATSTTNAALIGTRIYFRSNTPGTFQLLATVTDTGSGPASTTYPLLSTTGWTHPAQTPTTPTGGPYPSTAFTWTAGASTPGTYTVTATDTAGNTRTSAITFTADNTNPTGAITAPAASANTRGTLTITSSSADASSGVNNAQFQRSPAGTSTWTDIGPPDTATPYNTTWDTTTTPEGLYDLRVTTTDNAGNTFTSPVITNIRVDNTAPTGTITAPTAGANVRGTVAVTSDSADAGSGVANALFQRSPAGTGTWTNVATADTTSPYSASWSTTSLTAGLYDLRVITTDRSGNTFTSPITTVRVDNTAPTGSITAPASSANVRGTVTITSSSADAGSGVANALFQRTTAGGTVWTDIGPADTTSPYSSTWDTTGVAEGLYDLRVITTDNSGNTVTSPKITNVRVDNTAPTGAVTAPVAGANIRGTVGVTSSSADSGSGVANALFQRSPAGTDTWTNVATADTTSPYAASWVTTAVADGLYDLRVTTTDRSGNTFTSPISTVRVDNTAPTVALTATSTTNAALIGTRIYFRSNTPGTFQLLATVTDTGSGPASTTYPLLSTTGWTHPAQTPTTPTGGPYPSTAFTWTAGASTPGTYTVTATDTAGNTRTSAITFTADNTNPTGAITAPAASANTRGTLTITSSSADASSGVNNAQFQRSPAGTSTWTDIGPPDTATPYNTTWDTTTTPEGLYDLRVTTTDNAGNTFTSPVITNIRVDNTAPTGTITAPTAGSTASGASVAVAANSADTGSGVASAQFQVSAGGAGTWTNLGAADTTSPYAITWSTVALLDGPYDLQVITTDRSGNTFTSPVRPVQVDN